ncbi:response regulator [Halanaerobiaceae bacterium Z-7014]|uniref:Stage 0 sporulation protein A homolog n=1 Tax=Halonatronomonas betaini TaxID=2778430 RepID=A0A931F831_9FIRM|nr:response regulator [Halonatronomonas betaini]MBF8437306.1 response regulator [Halonatronomonas betaini]
MSDKNKEILVVEDDELIRGLQKNKLEKAGYEVDEAQNGLEAWNKIKDNRYILILIDIFLPKMDGFQLLKNIRSQEIPAKTIVLSSKSQDKYIKKAFDLGADSYLTKPFDPANLIKTVRTTLES